MTLSDEYRLGRLVQPVPVRRRECDYTVGKLDEAITLAEKILPVQKLRLGPDHPSTLMTMSRLACIRGWEATFRKRLMATN
jgi:hypothetical protein